MVAMLLSGCVVFDAQPWELGSTASSTELSPDYGTTQRPTSDDPCRAASRRICSDDSSARLSCKNGYPEVEVCPNGCVNGQCRPSCIAEGDLECDDLRLNAGLCPEPNGDLTTIAPCSDGEQTCALGACRPLNETCDSSAPFACGADSMSLRLCDQIGGAIEVTVRCGGDDTCQQYYQDWDGDGAGSVLVVSCGPPVGLAEDYTLVEVDGDCDEMDASIGPNQDEIPGDEIDQNCDGIEECFQNRDGDSERWEIEDTVPSEDTTCAAAGLATGDLPPSDCDDQNASIGRSVAEIPADGVDQNCDGFEYCFIDADGDGVSGGFSAGGDARSEDFDCPVENGFAERPEIEDCDDSNEERYPNAVEIAGDGIDQNCDESELCLFDFDDDGVPGGWAQVESDDLSCEDFDGVFTDGVWDCDDTGPGTDCVEGSDWVLIPAVPTRLGSPQDDELRVAGAEPSRDVSFSQPFILSRTEVTQAQWLEVFESNPSENFACSDCPVERVSWYDALAYANALSEAEGLEICYELDCVGEPGDGMVCAGATYSARCSGYRLPTAAEWEHAARAGTQTQHYGGVVIGDEPRTASSALIDVAVLGDVTESVGSKRPNAWGLFDMIGNVAEWTLDAVPQENAPPPQGGIDPLGTDGANRVVKGGGVGGFLTQHRSASLSFRQPGTENRDVGFRIARNLFEPAE